MYKEANVYSKFVEKKETKVRVTEKMKKLVSESENIPYTRMFFKLRAWAWA